MWVTGKGCWPRGALGTRGACAFGAGQTAPVRGIKLQCPALLWAHSSGGRGLGLQALGGSAPNTFWTNLP